MMKRPSESMLRLGSQLARWEEALEALRVTVNEDRPPANDVALADCYDDAVCDALGALREVRAEMRGANWSHPGAAARVLHQVHTLLNKLSKQHSATLVSWDRITAVTDVAARRGRAWGQWATALRRTLEALPETIFSTQEALAECWQEIAEQTRGGDTSTIHVNQN